MEQLDHIFNLIGISACSSGPVRVHGADVSVDDTRIRVSDGDRGGDGTFCPPGQAKKGRC
ncbi:hypothetical protein ACV1C5_19975 [Aeromonas caviae]